MFWVLLFLTAVYGNGALHCGYMLGSYMGPTMNRKRTSHLGFVPNELFQTYEVPSPTGSRRKVAIIELGGGYSTSDLDIAWDNMGYNLSQRPVVRSISINGATNNPRVSNDDYEVTMNIQAVGGLGNVDIDVLFAPNTLQGFYNAVSYAVMMHYRSISISWGSPEQSILAANNQAFEALFSHAASIGVSIFIASGNSGSSQGVTFPSSAPHAVACGGTTLYASGMGYAGANETGWSLSAGGNSGVFPGRTTPDVASVADPNTGLIIYISTRGNPGFYHIGGTSASAPIWAAIWHSVGSNVWARQVLYNMTAIGFHDITSGSNGAYSCVPGYDKVTGLGSPNPMGVAMSPPIAFPTVPPSVSSAPSELTVFVSLMIILISAIIFVC